MTNFRVDAPLPTVNEHAPTEDVSQLLTLLLNAQIPGFALQHELADQDSAEVVHKRHTQVIMAATRRLFNTPPQVSGPHTVDIGGDSSVHDDQFLRPTHVEKITKELRLHTPDSVSGADVVLVNTGPGREIFGDQDLFLYNFWDSSTSAQEERRLRGYEERPLENHFDLFDQITAGTFDPIATQNVVYHYRQVPYSSVVFTSEATFGPISAHGFTGYSEQSRCKVTMSEILVTL